MAETANAPALRRRLRVLQAGSILALLFALLIAAAIGASYFLTANVLTKDLAAQIRRATGFTTTIHGPAHFVLLPQPHIDIENISFANPEAGLHIDADGFSGNLRLLALLAGRAEVGHAVLYRPRMVIDVDDRPMTPDSALGRAANAKSASPEAAALDSAPLGIIDLVGGSARLIHRAAHDLFIDNINVTINWRSLYASATVTGGFDFRNAPMQVKAWFAQPVELLRGGQSAATLHLDSHPLTLSVSGSVSARQQFQYRGSFAASAPSLRKLAALAGLAFPKHGRFANLDLHCDATITSTTAAFTDLRMGLDGNDYMGTLALEADAPMASLSGTLATNLLDVTPFLEGLPRPRNAKGGWSSEALDLADLGFTNLDLRLSASQLRLGDIKIADAALSVLTRPGYLDLALAEGEANNGTIRGHLSLASHGKAINFRASGSAASVAIRPIFRGRDVKHPLLGTLSGSLVIESSGTSIDELMHHLSGHAQIHVANGQLVGVDLASALGKAPRQRLLVARDPDASVTNFDAANFALMIAQGTATISDGHIRGDGWTLGFGGTAEVGNRVFDLWALARPTLPQDGLQAQSAPLWITLKGAFERIRITAGRTAPAGVSSASPPAPSAPRNTPTHAPSSE